MQTLGNWIADVLARPGDAATAKRVQAEVRELTARFPIYAADA
jgi:glycine/serine hydroxymethyltransferase